MVADWLHGSGETAESQGCEKRERLKQEEAKDEKSEIFNMALIEGSRQVSDNIAGVCAIPFKSCTHKDEITF